MQSFRRSVRAIAPGLSMVLALALAGCGTQVAGRLADARSTQTPQALAVTYPADLMGQVFRFADADGNGRLSPAEIGLPSGLFSALDTNGDGQIDLAEWTGASTPALLARQSASARPLIHALFTRLDTNGDGRVSRAELTSALGASARLGGAFSKDFHAADRTGDEALDEAEFENFYQAFGTDATGSGADKGFPSLARALVGTYAVITGKLGSYFAIHAPRSHAKKTPADLGMAFENVSFPTSDGLTLRGWFVPAATPTDKTVIMIHGHTSTRAFAIADGQLAMVHDLYNVLTFDLRNNGESDGTVTTFGDREGLDALGAIDYLKGRGQHRLATLGVSMGGAVAIRAAALSPDVRGVVDDCTYAHMISPFVAFARYTKLPAAPVIGGASLATSNLELGFDMTRSEPITQVPAIAPRPFLVIHGLADPFIPYLNSQQNYDAAGTQLPKSLWLVPGAGHCGSSSVAPVEYRSRLRAFLASVL